MVNRTKEWEVEERKISKRVQTKIERRFVANGTYAVYKNVSAVWRDSKDSYH